MRNIIYASLAAAVAAASPAEAATKTVVVYEGVVDETTAGKFIDLIYDNIDKVIGLDIAVEVPTDEDSPLYVSKDDQLVVSWHEDDGPEMEVVINGSTGTTLIATHTVDGFYLIKSGGSHAAGALSAGAIPVDEASLRLNPNVQIIRKKF